MADRIFEDGDYDMSEVLDCLNQDFKSEKDLCHYLESHIIEFCTDCLNLEYSSHIREYPLSELHTRKKKGNKRIDFLIVTKDNQRIGIECKDPTYPGELQAALGQALTYLTLFEFHGKPLDKIWIISTKIDSTIPLTIDKFSLPLGFMAFDKSKFLIYQNGSSYRK